MDTPPINNTEPAKEFTNDNMDEAIHTFQDQAASSLTELISKSVPELANSPELKQALLSSLDISHEQQRIQSAYKSIAAYLQRSSYAVEMQEIQENWVQAFGQFTELLENKREINNENAEPLQEMIGLSPKTYDLFYAAGRDLYEQNAFEKAADVFFLMTIFNYCYSNVWISLGLSEQKCGRFESALKAFAMAVMTNIDSPEPYLCAADCCLAMNDLAEAKIYLDEAMIRLNKDSQYEPFRAVAARISKQTGLDKK